MGDSINLNNPLQEKILLMLLPFWAPLAPPQGITSLKSYLQKNKYNAKTIDANIISELWKYHPTYMVTLGGIIPKDKKSNFYMVGYDVLMNHLMVHLNYKNEHHYQEMVKTLVAKNFFIVITAEQALQLIDIVTEFYKTLQKYLLELIQVEKPSILGISVYNPTLAPSVFAFRLIKEHFPNITTIMGGGVFSDHLAVDSPNFQMFLDKTPFIDKFIIGEGELLLLAYLQGKLPESQRVYTRKDIQDECVDLSILDHADFSDFNLEMYPQLSTFASRSCPYQCSFCSETVQWGKYRARDVKQIVTEMISLYRTHQRQLFLLADSLVNPIITDLTNELLTRDISIYWDVYLRADKEACNQANTLLWRRGGFYRARLGVESGSQKILDLMNKKTSPEQMKQALISLANAGIKTTTYWIIGHPGETEDDFQATLEFIKDMKDYIYEADWHPFYFFPTGQVNSDRWVTENGISSLYPEDMNQALITPTWVLKAEPHREEIYNRMCRFAEQCNKNNIPNPYSLREIFEADKRWKLLHKNAVPSVFQFGLHTYIDENKKII
jgi:radical SAM superfamily enzyme YgiQ (UPF0313 family)